MSLARLLFRQLGKNSCRRWGRIVVAIQPRLAQAKPQPLTQPLKWHGGKHYLAKRIIGLLPEHTHYAEPFAGGLSVLLAKPCEGISEAVNDLHQQLTTFWQVLADPQLFDQLYRQPECTPLSQPLFDQAAEQSGTAVEQAAAFFIRARQSRQGHNVITQLRPGAPAAE